MNDKKNSLIEEIKYLKRHNLQQNKSLKSYLITTEKEVCSMLQRL